MSIAVDSYIDGAFEGYAFEKTFRLVNGQVWRQVTAKYQYQYLWRPRVVIRERGGSFMMDVADMEGSIEVRLVK